MGGLAFEPEVPGFTPVRRRDSTVNTREQHGEPEKEWTAARCNRLLRALTSRIAILKKDISRFRSTASSKSSEVQVSAAAGQKRRNPSSNDPDWTQSRKRIKRTYSARGGKNNNDCRANSEGTQLSLKDGKRLIPGEFSIPTPILNRARGEPSGNQPSPCVPARQDNERQDGKGKKRSRIKDGEACFQLSQTMREIRKTTPSSRTATYERIHYALEALLKVTAMEDSETKRRGPRSLLSTCLRVVPSYIAEEELLLSTELEETGAKSAFDRRDVSTEIYDDLEAFGSSGHGWKHLRTVVRSHGIHVVCEAMQDGLLEVEFCALLITLCVNMGAAREAEILLTGVLSIGDLPEPKTVFTRFDDGIATRPLSLFWKFVGHANCLSYQYRQLSSMVVDGLLPISWLATKEFVTFWTKVIQEFTSGSANPTAISFLNQVLPMLASYGEPDDGNKEALGTTNATLSEAVRQTFSSLITTLTTVVILSKETASQKEESKASPPDYDGIITVLRSCLVQCKLCNMSSIKGTLLALAVLFVVGPGDGDSIDGLVELFMDRLRQIGRFSQLSMLRNDLVAFVCSVARCCGRGASSPGFVYLQHLHVLLETLADSGQSDERRLLQRIIVDSASAFAQQATDRKHLEYAASVEDKFLVKSELNVSSPTKSPGDMVGYRWEEGIGEWVTATPAVNGLKTNMGGSFADQTDPDTPFRPSIRRRPAGYPVCEALMAGLAPSSDNDIAHDYDGESLLGSLGDGTGLSELGDYSDGLDDSRNADEDFPSSVSGTHFEADFENASDDELLQISPQSERLHTAESSAPSPSPASDSSMEAGRRRRYVDRAPRLSRRVLQNSLQWQLFDESDDELSFSSISSPSGSILQDSTNSAGIVAGGNGRALRRTTSLLKRLDPVGKPEGAVLFDSEDELCI